MVLEIPLNSVILSETESRKVDGGVAWLAAVFVVAAGVVAVYEAGKAVGEFSYWITH